jgi:hypothetical protein
MTRFLLLHTFRADCMKVWRQEQAKTKTEYRGPSLRSG